MVALNNPVPWELNIDKLVKGQVGLYHQHYLLAVPEKLDKTVAPCPRIVGVGTPTGSRRTISMENFKIDPEQSILAMMYV